MKLHQKPHPAGRRAPAMRSYADVEAFPSDDFTSAFMLVSDKLHSEVSVPAILSKGAVVNEHTQRLMLAAMGFFDRNQNKALSFTFRYQAFLKLVVSGAVDAWVQKHDGNEGLAVYHPSLLAVAGRAPLQNDGTFARDLFIESLKAVSTVDDVPGELDAEAALHRVVESVAEPRIAA